MGDLHCVGRRLRRFALCRDERWEISTELGEDLREAVQDSCEKMNAYRGTRLKKHHRTYQQKSQDLSTAPPPPQDKKRQKKTHEHKKTNNQKWVL